MGDFAGKFAGKAEGRGRQLHPAADGVFGGWPVKGAVYFDGRKIARVELEPMGLGEIGRIKRALPVRKRPGVGADSNLLLVSKVQAKKEGNGN